MQSTLTVNAKAKPAARSGFAKWPKWVLWLILAVLVLGIGAGVYYYVHAKQTAAATQAATPALQTATARTGNIVLRASGTGTLIAPKSSSIGFGTTGTLIKLNVQVGNVVKAGDLLAQLDNTNQTIALAQAQAALNELTSPTAIANAQIAVANDEGSVINAQAALNNQQYWQNTNLVQNEYAAVVLAKANLDKAQANYDRLHTGGYISNTEEAAAYQELYNATQAYNTAQFYYSLYSQAPTQRQVDLAKANLALAQAKLVEDQNLVTALTGGTVPAKATGSGLNQLNQAKLAVQNAQANLNDTNLYAPISGTVLTINNTVGDTINSGNVFMTIADRSQSEIQIYMDSLDFSNIKVGYSANIVFDALPNQTYTGKVTLVSPQLVTIQGNSVVQGIVLMDKKQASGATLDLPLGVTASVDIIAAQANNVIEVPIQALHELSPNNYAVFVMANGKPVLRIVTVGLQDSSFAEIKTGLKAGEVVSTGIQATNSGRSTTGSSNQAGG